MNRGMRLVAFLLFLVAMAARAQQPIVHHYARTDYQSGKQNWDIDMTASGVMLFANDKGLLTFDSQEWHSYPLSNFSTVRCIKYDKEKDIVYAGGTNEFGYYAHREGTGTLAYHSLVQKLPKEDRNFGEMWAIFRCENGNYVFSAKQHVFVMKPDGSFTSFHLPSDMQCASLSPMGTILANRDTVYTIRNMKLQALPGTERLKNEVPLSIIPYKGKVLFGTAHNGFFIYDGKTTEPWDLDITPYIREHQLFCATMQDDVLAVGTVRGGLVVKNLKTGHTSYANMETGMMNNTVLSIRFDELKNIWVGLDQGIAHVLNEAPYQQLLGGDARYGTGYASLVDGNRLLLGTNQGLYATPYPLTGGATPPTLTLLSGMTGQIWSIRRMGDAILCGGNRGAWQVRGDQCIRIEGLVGTWDFQPLKNRPDYALCCDYHGLAVLKLEGGLWKLHHRVEGFEGTSSTFFEGPDGYIWLSQWQQGIYRLKLSGELTAVMKTQMFNRGNGLPTDDNNLVARIGDEVVITAADGFHRFNSQTEKTEPYKAFNQLFGIHKARLRLQEGPHGEVWAFNNDLVMLAKPDKTGALHTDSLTFRHIAQGLQHAFGHIGFMPDGSALFNTETGFILTASQQGTHHHPSYLFVRRVTSTNEGDSILYEAPTSAQDTTRTIQHELTIDKALNSLRIEFILPEYASENSVSYSCFLEGYDRTWSNVTANEKEYTRLPKGTYLLHVRCFNNLDGQTQETTFVIRILPAWYETWWAYLLYALMAVVALYLLVRYVRLRYERKIKAVKEQKRRELKEQEMQFEMERQSAEIERQRQEHEMMQMKNEQMELELKHKSSQLADSTMNLIRKNEILQELDQRMSDLSESVRREDTKAKQVGLIREIRSNINSNINDNEHWDTFEQNFNLVYNNFLMKLTKQFPILKLPDRKLCAYLKMGLSSKEIASLLNSSVRSIETARYRLRKKLELEQGDNLQDFLQNYQ